MTAGVSPQPAVTGQPVKRPHSLRRTLRNALIITRREVRDSLRDWRIIAPIVILTFVFPFVAQFVTSQFFGFLIGFGAPIVAERSIPFMLMVVGFFPISISLVIALETFVGEKERRSLEPLLATPLSNTELYIGKALASMLPPLISSLGGMAFYLAAVSLGELAWRPQPMLLLQIILLTVVQALVMVTGAVVVSSQATSTRAANLLASFIIVPMALMVQVESAIMFLAPDAASPRGINALWAIILGMFVIAVMLLRVGAGIFNREELLGRVIDSLNLRGMIRRLGANVAAVNAAGEPARNLLDWYRRGMPFALKRSWGAIAVTLIVFVTAFVVGMYAATQLPQFSPEVVGQVSASEALDEIDQLGSGLTFDFYLIQNGRILLLAVGLSVISFGVAALIATPLVYGVLGYLFMTFMLFEMPLSVFFAAVIPHAIFEVPAIVLAAAAGVRIGAAVTRIPRGYTVGQAWFAAFGDMMKLFIGLALPALVMAAIVESWVTPSVLRMVLTGLGAN